jgi:hypothetical protein
MRAAAAVGRRFGVSYDYSCSLASVWYAETMRFVHSFPPPLAALAHQILGLDVQQGYKPADFCMHLLKCM